MPRKRQRSSKSKDLSMEKAPPQLKNAQDEIFPPEEAPEEAVDAPTMLESFVYPNGFKIDYFKGVGWISYHPDFAFTRSVKRYRGPLCRELELSNGPTPPKKRKGKAPAALGNHAADIIINGRGAGYLILKRDSQLKARLYIPEGDCPFTNLDYVRTFLGYQCILVENDDMFDGITGHARDRLLVATIELLDIRGRVYMMLPKEKSFCGPTMNGYMKWEPECVLNEGNHDIAYGEDETSNSPKSSAQSTPEQMNGSVKKSTDYVGGQNGRVSETSGNILRPPMVRIPKNSLTEKIRREIEEEDALLGFPSSSSTDDSFAEKRARAMEKFLCSYEKSVLVETASTSLESQETNRETGTNVSPADNTRLSVSAQPITNIPPVIDDSPGDNTLLNANAPLLADAASDDNAQTVANISPVVSASAGDNTLLNANAPLFADAASDDNAQTVANAPSAANASAGVAAPLVVSSSSGADVRPGANASPDVNAPSCVNVQPVASIRINTSSHPPTGTKTMEQWQELAKNDNVLKSYLDKIYLWNLIQLFRPEWKSFSKPVRPNGYPALPTPDEYHESHGMLPENTTNKQKQNARRTILRLLKK